MEISGLIEMLQKIQRVHGDLWIEDGAGSLREAEDVIVVLDGKGNSVAVRIASTCESLPSGGAR